MFIRREKLRKDALAVGKGTPRLHNDINDRRKSLRERVDAHHMLRVMFMGSAPAPDHPKRSPVLSPDPEHSELGLPSSYLMSSLTACCYQQLAKQEAKLRRAVCNDSLQVVKNLLGAKALALKHKRKNLRGEGATTRAESALRDQNEKVSRAQWRYNHSRTALLRLSAAESDHTTYLELKRDDLKILKSYLEDDSRGLGQGYQSIPWLWRTRASSNDEEWQVEGKVLSTSHSPALI